MARTDEYGNKLLQPRVHKKIKSANERERASKLPTRCSDCGYHVRSSGHSKGSHHQK